MKSVMTKSTSQYVPQRTCIGCREIKPKRELIRLVRTDGNTVEIDPSGHKSGRGAYLCPNEDCWEKGIAGKRLDYVLRLNLTAENRAQIMSKGKDFWGTIA